ncbi:MAG: ABC transporter permease [Alphaproteobacteria bacterium]|nr:ABC transporter permease [Alphaproteobacteria bacterium]
MSIFAEATATAFSLIINANADLLEIIGLSMKVSLSALLIACILGLPIGALLGTFDFAFKNTVKGILTALMGMPPVVVGLIVYLHLSRSGLFGALELLYTPTAMIIAQVILITPIIAVLSSQILEDLHEEYRDLFISLVVPPPNALLTYLIEARYSLLTVILAGFGRAISEVGAVMIVGGNIDHLTRVMTTAIALETSKGELALALALGLILLILALFVNFAAQQAKSLLSVQRYGG